ncbi:exopolysaccharide transport family protein [uncultured Algibacter sp.]|uniref:exopolysaccharide transport family protein n=1 Tax=uncultured Algibacter sp. TaxID=298659 RepID=UPI00261C9D4D|nr:tyrosine-protein kinase [uncultured Algibacter sp.]
MSDYNNSNIDDEGLNFTFDFKGFFYKVTSKWKLILFCILIGLVTAYFINVRKQNVYSLNSLISVENNKSPFSSANTSISFNWGGVSGKVGQVMTSLKTRTHNESVVDSLKFYIDYLEEGEYQKIDVYKKAPFVFTPKLDAPQLLNEFIGIRFLNETSFELFTEFEDEQGKGQIYGTKAFEMIYNLPVGVYDKTYRIGQIIELPFMHGVLELKPEHLIKPNETYFLRFRNFDKVVSSFQNNIKVAAFQQSSSVIQLALAGHNKNKIVEYLNATSAILSQTELERKNQYATNTIKFIDSSLASVDGNIKEVSQAMDNFRRKNKVFNVADDMQKVSRDLQLFEAQQVDIKIKLNYLNSLETYLKTEQDYSGIAAPTSVGITEVNILNGVSAIIVLSTERRSKEFTTREESSVFENIDRQIEAEKNVLLATIQSTKNTLETQLETVSTTVKKLDRRLSDLPNNQQEFLKIQRQLNISQEAYTQYIIKRSEAAISRAANVSDITIVDSAKDIGGGKIGPDTSLSYMMGALAGTFIPVVILFLLYFLDNTVHGPEDIKRISNIPILGVIGKHTYHNNLVVSEMSKSSVAESFRAIRSSLQFVIKKNSKERATTLLVTSSVGGEGKTFCSINMATVYALSGRKTVLVGLDLRKPKIFGDFDLNNDIGVVNYLIGQHSLKEITNTTSIKNLDVITAGPVPPNPSELLISESMDVFVNKLKAEYDIIILDTPPLGIVTDALDLTKYSDTNIFMIRLNYTKKSMLQFIKAKYKSKEIKNISFVLNFYRPNNHQNLNYGYGYGYGVYGNNYHETERQKKSVKSRFKRVFKRNKNS